MRKLKILLIINIISMLIVIGITSFLLSCKQNEIALEEVTLKEITCDSIDEGEILRLVNQIRTVGYVLEDDTNKFITSSLEPLAWDNNLKVAAMIQSTYMVEYNDYSHTWIDNTNLSKRIYMSGFQNNAKEGISADENIARGHKTEQAVVKGWLNSKPHREAMLKPTRDVIGVARRTHPEGMFYWTMVLSYKGHKIES